MFARVSTYQGSPEKVADGIRHVEQTSLDGMPGLKGTYLLVNRQSGKAITITLWESEEALNSTAGAASPLRAGIGQAFGDAGQPTVEMYEVALAD
jgi:heme-degrading monooxygenase HmoA